jgi:type I restriction enzyme S subunit
MQKCKLNGGELIIVRSGVNTGDCAVVPSELRGAYAAYDLIVEPGARVLPEYLCACLYASFGKAQIDIVKNRAAQPHINADEVRALEIPKLIDRRPTSPRCRTRRRPG